MNNKRFKYLKIVCSIILIGVVQIILVVTVYAIFIIKSITDASYNARWTGRAYVRLYFL